MLTQDRKNNIISHGNPFVTNFIAQNKSPYNKNVSFTRLHDMTHIVFGNICSISSWFSKNGLMFYGHVDPGPKTASLVMATRLSPISSCKKNPPITKMFHLECYMTWHCNWQHFFIELIFQKRSHVLWPCWPRTEKTASLVMATRLSPISSRKTNPL